MNNSSLLRRMRERRRQRKRDSRNFTLFVIGFIIVVIAAGWVIADTRMLEI